MKYRKEIDGLRALAVIPVMLFHAGFELFSGGFAGVDVFFVISGYLITAILIKDIENQEFSFTDFYERRARRILPALFFVIVVSFFLAWVILPDQSLNKFGRGLISISFFASNVFFWRQEGYFDNLAELNPLLHTWSLAVEEQYYILFPIFLAFVWRFGKSNVIFITVLLGLVSFFLSEWGWRNHASANFYLAPTRAWELLSGSITAFMVHKYGVYRNNLLSFVGLSAIIIPFFVYNVLTPFPSFYTILPVLGTVLIIMFAGKGTIVFKLLSTKPLVGIGLISYSAYLWHQPIFAFTRVYLKQFKIDKFISSMLVILTILIAFFSWKYIEAPFRKKRLIKRKSILYISVTFLISIFILGYVSNEVSSGTEHKLARSLSENNFIYVENMCERTFMKARLLYKLEPVKTVVVGSSRVMQINSKIIGHNIQSLTVSGASIEDNIALGLEGYAKLKYNEILISADPWIINTYDNQDRYKSINELYVYWLKRMKSNQKPRSYLSSTTKRDFASAENGIFSFIRNRIKLKELMPRNASVEQFEKRAYDGSLIYNENFVNQSESIIKSKFRHLLNYNMEKFEYDQTAISHLEVFISYLKSHGVNVTLVLSPYHPELYKLMELEKPIFIEIEDWFRNFAKNNGVKIIGSYNPSYIDCAPEEFYDGMHPKSSCMKKLLDLKE